MQFLMYVPSCLCIGHILMLSSVNLSEVWAIALYKSVYTDALTQGSSKLPTVYCTLIFQINPSQHILITCTMWICVIWYCESIMTDLQQHPADTLTFSLTSRVTVAPLAQHQHCHSKAALFVMLHIIIIKFQVTIWKDSKHLLIQVLIIF